MIANVAFGAALLVSAASGTTPNAHQLDEYLQATTIAVGKDRVRAEVRLTPGVAVVSRILAVIDQDANGVISAAEQRSYAARVRRDLSLAIDGTPLSLRAVGWTFATIEEMKQGRGTIRIDFEATVPHGAGTRQLTFENIHQVRIAAYLVNALVPRDPDIRITGQHRTYEQSSYQLDYSQAGARPTQAKTVRASSPSALLTGGR